MELTADRRPGTAANTSTNGRALVVVEKTAASARRRTLTGRTLQRSTAFLAHLSLQYDDITARRRERNERLSRALASYGTKPQKRYHPTISVDV